MPASSTDWRCPVTPVYGMISGAFTSPLASAGDFFISGDAIVLIDSVVIGLTLDLCLKGPMSKSIREILQAFMAGETTARATNHALLSHFQASSSEKRQSMTRQYIDEIIADLEGGLISIDTASEGLVESATASHI